MDQWVPHRAREVRQMQALADRHADQWSTAKISGPIDLSGTTQMLVPMTLKVMVTGMAHYNLTAQTVSGEMASFKYTLTLATGQPGQGTARGRVASVARVDALVSCVRPPVRNQPAKSEYDDYPCSARSTSNGARLPRGERDLSGLCSAKSSARTTCVSRC